MTGGPALLADRVAVVTGGGGGIGRGVTRRLAAAGATVVVNDIDPTLLAQAVDEGIAGGGRVVPVEGDTRRDDTVDRLCEAARAVDGDRIDVLVNNVGDFRPNGMFLKSTPADWETLYALNLGHVFACTRAIAPVMTAQGS